MRNRHYTSIKMILLCVCEGLINFSIFFLYFDLLMYLKNKCVQIYSNRTYCRSKKYKKNVGINI